MVPASRSATLTERWTFAEEYCPSLQLWRHQNSFTTSMEPSGRAEEASFTKRVRRHSLTVSASSSEKPVFSASWTLMEPLISYRPKRTKCFRYPAYTRWCRNCRLPQGRRAEKREEKAA